LPISAIRLSSASALKPPEAPGQTAGQSQSVGEPTGNDRSIAHVLLVAGLRAAGKSTFLEQLMRAELPDEVAARIPAGAGSWPQYWAGYHLLWRPLLWSRARRQRLRPTGKEPTFALHYDLMRLPWAGLEDPALAAARSARRLTIVTIRPPADRLLGQYHRRRRERLASFGSGKQPSRTAALYTTEGWVDDLYGRWSDAMAEFAPPAAIDWLEIEPVASGPHKAWRIRSDKADISSEIAD
jgi:hypothetical protein